MKEKFMRLAIEQARIAAAEGEVPVGAVIVKDGKVISVGRNVREKTSQADGHAEMIAIRNACEVLNSPFLTDCDIYVTLEPCPMCAGAILQARIHKVIFGAYEEKSGAVGSVFNLFYDFVFPHKVLFEGGVLEEECLTPLTDFFKEKR
ncbi:MAG: nucleoside deaminase [Monoglobales bacterium]